MHSMTSEAYEDMKRVVKVFCDTTTAHGIVRLQTGSSTQRVIWLCLVPSAFIAFSVHTGSFCKKRTARRRPPFCFLFSLFEFCDDLFKGFRCRCFDMGQCFRCAAAFFCSRGVA